MVLIPHCTTALTVGCGFLMMLPTSVAPPHLCLMAWISGLFFDVLDGVLARRLNATSLVGANFDMIADLSCFGIAPACFFVRQQLGGGSDALVLGASFMYMLSAVFRIAREMAVHSGARPFAFVGIPTNLASVASVPLARWAPVGAWPSLVMLLTSVLMLSRFHVPKGLGIVKISGSGERRSSKVEF